MPVWRETAIVAPPIFAWFLFIFNIYPFRKFDPSGSNDLKFKILLHPIEGDSLNLAALISVAQNSSLISLIAQALNTVRLAV